MATLQEKTDKLKEHLRELGSVAVAFSAGVDSALLLKVAHDTLGDKCIAVTAKHPTFFSSDFEMSQAFCRDEGIEHIILEKDTLADKKVRENSKLRCYYCKLLLMQGLLDVAKERGIPYVIDGTNVDDKGDYRPGMKALAELKIISPLMEAGFHKNDVRDLAKELGLPVWNKPENACLATRIPYGEEITVPKLQMIEQGEEKIKEFVTGHVRVRMRGKDAKIEVDAKEISRIMKNDVMSEVFDHLTGLGFEGVELDIMGYRRGG